MKCKLGVRVNEKGTEGGLGKLENKKEIDRNRPSEREKERYGESRSGTQRASKIYER